MEIGQTPTTVTPPAASAFVSSEAAAEGNSDFEMFLQMLTTQMKYQDPLSPVDSTDYATQLATFSNVEQGVLTNDLLKSLTAQMSITGLSDMAAWVGKDVLAIASTHFDGQPIAFDVQPAAIADTAAVVVRDDTGAEVARIDIPVSAKTTEWDGTDQDGTQMPDGLYSFEVVSTLNDEVIAQNTVAVYNRVSEIRFEAGEMVLILEGGGSIPREAIIALRESSG